MKLAGIVLGLLAGSAGLGSGPAEESGPRNVQLLQGMSRLRLQRTMNLMRASLGVHCDYCHVVTKEAGWQWDKDDKEPKRTARRMIRMVGDINREHFGGVPVVNCNTCHRGAIRPAVRPLLPQPPPPFPTALTTHSGEPTVAEVMARYVEAVGGPAAAESLAKARTSILRGTREGWNDRPSRIEVVQSGDKLLVTLADEKGTRVEGFDGARGFARSDGPATPMADDELERFLDQRAAFRPFAPSGVGKDAAVVGRETVAGRDAWEVAAPEDASTRLRLWFDVENGLLLRRITERDGPIGRVPEQLDLSDYRKVGEARVPFVQRLSLVDPWSGSTRRLDEVRLDEPVEGALFQP